MGVLEDIRTTATAWLSTAKQRFSSTTQPLPLVLHWARRLFVAIMFTVGVVLTGFEIYERLPDPLTPYAITVSKAADSNTQPDEFHRGFATRFRSLTERELQERDESLVDAETLANECLSDPACTIFIGNSTSTLTSRTLDVFLDHEDQADRPVFVMPFATATDLTRRAKERKYGGVIRLVPDNNNQADVIVSLLEQRLIERQEGDTDGPRVIIYIDEDNPTYANGLARAVASGVRESGGYVLEEEHIGPSNSALPTLTTWQDMKNGTTRLLDAVIYAGTAHHCLLLIDQMVQLRSDVPVVFTDGCSLQDFNERAKKLKGGAYLLAAAESYSTIGEDAAALLNALIRACPNCKRSELTGYLARNKKNALMLSESDVSNSGRSRDYQFDFCGNNLGMDFVVWETTRDGERRPVELQRSVAATGTRTDDDCNAPVTAVGGSAATLAASSASVFP